MNWLAMDRWSPYAVGVCIGVLNTIALILLEKPIGCSTAFARTSGMIEKLARGERVCRKPYYQAFPPSVDWEWMLVLGVIIGAALSAWLSGTWALQWVPEMWRASFGPRRVQARCRCAGRRRVHGVGRALGWRLHERPWHQRHCAACRQ